MTATASATAAAATASPARSQAVPLLAEASLVLVTLTAIATLGRLFETSSYVSPLVATALIAHGAAILLRRTRLGPLTVVLIAVGGGIAVLGWLRYLETTFLGIPTGETFSIARQDLADAWTQFGEVVAPAPVLPGFLLGACIAVWVAAWVSDWAAFRLGSAVEAVVPASAIVVFAALLGGTRHRTATTVAFVAATLAFVLFHRVADQVTTGTWVGNGRRQGPPAVAAFGLGMVAIAVLFGALAGPRAPGAGADAMLDWNGGGVGDGTRVTVSPLVDIRQRLVDQSAVEAFTVQSPRRSYWRLTALDAFDGTVWASSGSFGKADGELPGGRDRPSATVVQDFRVTGLSAIWLPAAYEPVDVRTDGTDVRYDSESATLIVDTDSASSDGITYQVTSAVPEIRLEQLDRNAGSDIPLPIRRRYLELPSDFPEVIDDLAAELMADGENPYQRARLLQDFFRREFTYDLTGTRSGHSDQAIGTFLESRRGYCEQFAGTFAAMARSQGIPARVAVGFTPGEAEELEEGIRFTVRGRNAHAWPEVWINEAGWVPFEPTPGRGAPGAEAWTGVPEAQVAQDTTPTTDGSSPTTEDTIPNTLPPDDGPAPDGGLETTDGGGSAESGGPLSPLVRIAIALGVAVAAGAAWVGLLAAARALRARVRRRQASTEAARVRLAWLESAEAAGRIAPPLRPAETHTEFAARMRPVLGPASRPLTRLAGLATATEWSDQAVDPQVVTDARQLSHEVQHEVKETLDLKQRLVAWVDPRQLLRR